MNLPQDQQELIEQYLNGQLTGEALRDFENRMAIDNSLAAEVNFQREMQAFLADTPENELRKTLQMLSDQVVEQKEEEDKGWFWALFPAGDTNILDWLFGHPARHLAWLLPLLLVAGWWHNRIGIKMTDPSIAGYDTLKNHEGKEENDNAETIVATSIAPPEDAQKQLIKPKPSLPEKIIEENPTPVVQLETSPMPIESEIPTNYSHLEMLDGAASLPSTEEVMAIETPSSKVYDLLTPPTLYWYDSEVEPKIDFFNPSMYLGTFPLLDSLMMVTRTNNDYKIKVVEKPKVIFLAENVSQADTIYQKVPLKLIIETDKDLFQDDPVLYVKDNRGNPYGPFSLSESLKLDGENRYILETQIPLWDNTPRLVYYSVEDYRTKVPYFVDKVAVLPKDSIFKKADFPWKGPIILLASPEFRLFESGEIPDFFNPNPKLESAMANNLHSADFSVTTIPIIPDTFYIPDTLLTFDATSSDSLKSISARYMDKIFKYQLVVHSMENLFEAGLNYNVTDNLDFSIKRNYDYGDGITKKYGTNTYFLDFNIGYDADYPEGLYYYQIYAGSQTFTGKYVIVSISTKD